MVTVAFSELRQNLTQVAEKVANEGEEVVVFKRSKPLFKIVPLDYPGRRSVRCSRRMRTTRSISIS